MIAWAGPELDRRIGLFGSKGYVGEWSYQLVGSEVLRTQDESQLHSFRSLQKQTLLPPEILARKATSRLA